ncbi:hypothetical protein M405DRAFT_865221 [Rhizopogon salebrosus TDB-379]|nr:hypothetical protein M405DRAFT_865221 [Rhizopogon salebrosus TDB-379]
MHWAKVKFGERYTIYNPKDGQPCMDYDRSDGEGANPQEYTGVKMEVIEWSPAAKATEGKVGGRKVFLVAATYVAVRDHYGVFAINDTEAFVCTYRSARNMTFRGLSPERSKIEQLMEMDGAAMVGTKIKAPFGLVPEVYVLPMDNVLATEGTGVVTSIHSDSPGDFANVTDLRRKFEFNGIRNSLLCAHHSCLR